jgi:hypothetical protein
MLQALAPSTYLQTTMPRNIYYKAKLKKRGVWTNLTDVGDMGCTADTVYKKPSALVSLEIYRSILPYLSHR